jgi:hypothetical protein
MGLATALKSTFVVGVVVSLACPVAAAPTVYRRPGSRLGEVQNHTVAAVLGDHRLDDHFYALPPNRGRTEIVGVTYGANIGFCREMADIQGTNRFITQRIANMTDQIDELYVDIELLRAEQGQHRRRMADLYQDDDVRRAVDLEEALTTVELAIASLQLQSLDCYEANDPETCAVDTRSHMRELLAQRAELMGAYVTARRAAAAQYAEYLRAKRSMESIDDEVEELEEDLDRKTERLVALHSTVRSLYEGYSRLEGALIQVAFDSGWDEVLGQLRADNPRFSFEKIATREARVDLSLVPGLGQETVPTGRIVLGYTVDGVRYDPTDPTSFLGGYPGSHGAMVSASLLGACFHAHPEYFDIDPTTPAGTPVFGLTVRYQYPSSFYTHAWGSYDKWEAYQYLKRIEERGFLWWKETDVSEDIDHDGQGWLEVHIDSEEALAPEDILGMRNQIRLELLQQVLLELGEAQYDPGGPPSLLRPSSGVQVVAAGVDDTCGWYSIMCRGVRWVLLGLDAIFPGPDAEARFESRYRRREHFNYSADVVRWLPATTTFTDLVVGGGTGGGTP